MKLPERKLTRLPDFDYSEQNYYYVTICTHQKRHIFWDVDKLNAMGRIAEEELLSISDRFDGVKVDKYVIMPNHIHAIIVIGCEITEQSRLFPTLSTVIGLYKSGVSKRIHTDRPSMQIWQKSFYDRIIRDEHAYIEVWRYIDENPVKWQFDQYWAHF